MKTIPSFIDTRYEEHHIVYDNMCKIFKLFNICIIKEFLSSKGIGELSAHYYTYLLTIYNTSQDLYKPTLDYMTDVYQEILSDLESNDCYEASYNLYHMVNIGTIIDDNINENEEE